MGIKALFSQILRSFALARLACALRSPLYWLLVAAGFAGFFLSGTPLPARFSAVVWFVVAPCAEELTWRACLQNELAGIFRGPGRNVFANIVISLLFAGAHILFAFNLMSVLVFFPSLCFGFVWTRSKSLWACSLLHLWYNLTLRLDLSRIFASF